MRNRKELKRTHEGGIAMFGRLRDYTVGFGSLALIALGITESLLISTRRNLLIDSFLVTLLDLPFSFLSLFD